VDEWVVLAVADAERVMDGDVVLAGEPLTDGVGSGELVGGMDCDVLGVRELEGDLALVEGEAEMVRVAERVPAGVGDGSGDVDSTLLKHVKLRSRVPLLPLLPPAVTR